MSVDTQVYQPARGALARWFAASATLTVPQAAAPVAFSLVALGLTGETGGGAAMMLAMTFAQVVGAVPIIRLGKNLPVTTCFRALVALRAVALGVVTLCAHYHAPFVWLIVFAGIAGLVNGAAYGYLRSLLNQFTLIARLPRALGIAVTLNEVTFVLAPVAASVLGSVSPVFALLALTVLGALPALLIPTVERVAQDVDVPSPNASLLTRPIFLWLSCAAAGGATVAAIEIGAVALALSFGYEPAMAILFTVPLCIASVAGGVWVSVSNSMPGRRAVIAQLCVMGIGAALAALGHSLAMTVVGAVLIGAVLAPLGTFYALILETLTPPHRRPEVFALLRTANAMGVILASAVLTAVSISITLVVVAVMMVAVTLTVIVSPSRQAA